MPIGFRAKQRGSSDDSKRPSNIYKHEWVLADGKERVMSGILGTKEMLDKVQDLKEQTLLNGFRKTEDVDKFFDENWMHILDILDDALYEYLNK